MPSAVRPRSSSASTSKDVNRANKRVRAEPSVLSSINIPSSDIVDGYREAYMRAQPYRHTTVGGLLSDELLEGVVEESRTYGIRGEEGSLPGWGFEQKETDIYKIQQTPDLSSLDPEHLPEETLAALPTTNRLKEALYSPEFRNFVRQITGCGPLSGKKKDLSCSIYTEGSHLLLHDDSISTRLISYILYLPNTPLDAPTTSSTNLTPSANGKFLKGWDPKWGGALELFPVASGEDAGPPGVKRSTKIDVSWGQINLFEVQPGKSYHSVEEVVVGDGRQRLNISGWFHRPVEGEEGYEPFDAEKAKEELSSLAQITAAPTIPFTPYTAEPPAGLTPTHITALAPFLAPSYLTATTLEKLSGQFVAASEIVLHNFLHPDLANKLKEETQAADQRDYPSGASTIPAQELGEGDGWSILGPASKHRYLNLTTQSKSTPTVNFILDELLPSEAFRAWLSVVSSLAPVGYRAEARRFRKGLDYTLANGEDKAGEARLDVCLGATWWADVPAGSDEEDTLFDHGGWDCYLAAPDEGEDPAVYQSTLARKAAQEDAEAVQDSAEANPEPSTSTVAASGGEQKDNGNGKGAGPSISMNGTELEFDPDQFSPSDFDSDSENGGEEEDDAPLLTQPVSFNKLLLVLRDPGVMKFTKYLSALAPGSRWDVGGEWEVGMLEAEDDDGDNPEAEGEQ